jgi:DNA polymerase
MRTMYLDFETRSAVSLHDCGAHTYALNPTTQPLSLHYAIEDAEPLQWLPTDPVPAVFAEIAASPDEWQLVAHNAPFDRAVYDHVLVPRYGFPVLPAWIWRCSQRLALANAYPAELDLLAQALAGC